jgi:hypothetical protein
LTLGSGSRFRCFRNVFFGPPLDEVAPDMSAALTTGTTSGHEPRMHKDPS